MQTADGVLGTAQALAAGPHKKMNELLASMECVASSPILFVLLIVRAMRNERKRDKRVYHIL